MGFSRFGQNARVEEVFQVALECSTGRESSACFASRFILQSAAFGFDLLLQYLLAGQLQLIT
jgi:hypothetical protein